MKRISAKCRVQSAEKIPPRIVFVGILVLGILAFPLLANSGHEDSSCISCHANLDTENARPAERWESDIHRLAGLLCTDCHGGDPKRLERAMDPGKGFIGAPEGMDSVRLCGGCHSDSDRISSPVLPTGQLNQFLSGPHGKSILDGHGGPTCVTCHGAHGIVPVAVPSSPLFGTDSVKQCLGCHGAGDLARDSTAKSYLEGVHFNALEEGRNLNAPSCVDCHGAHRALTPGPVVSARICGRCHNRELAYYRQGPHGRSLLSVGQPACTDCHDHHRTQATGLEELVGRISDRCWSCHPTGSGPWEQGRAIDSSLTRAMSLLEELKQTSLELALGGIQTSRIDQYNREAYSWLVQVESALHSVDTQWEELTGMAKVKMMASLNLSRDHFLERRIRSFVFLLLGLLSAGIFLLLAVKLNFIEKELHRRHALGSPEARQREQERHGR
ncbi:MAG: cytochrome c3 family protein [bacterium]|nr:cytochrome c3 family protein [bacterium]